MNYLECRWNDPMSICWKKKWVALLLHHLHSVLSTKIYSMSPKARLKSLVANTGQFGRKWQKKLKMFFVRSQIVSNVVTFWFSWRNEYFTMLYILLLFWSTFRWISKTLACFDLMIYVKKTHVNENVQLLPFDIFNFALVPTRIKQYKFTYILSWKYKRN